MPDVLDDALRGVAAALVADAPLPPPFPAPRLTGTPHSLKFAIVAAVGLIAAAVLLVTQDDHHDRVRTIDAPSSHIQDPLLVFNSAEEVVGTRLESLPFPTGFVAARVESTPDGRIVALGSRDLEPGVPRTDGPDVTGVAFPLIVLNKEGHLAVDRDIRELGRYVTLLGATNTDAILLRTDATRLGQPSGPGTLIAHDLANGQERVIANMDVRPDRAVAHGNDFLLLTYPSSDETTQASRPRTSCPVGISSIAAGFVGRVDLADCGEVIDARLSPDGQRLAVAYYRFTAEVVRTRLAVLDVSTGAEEQDDDVVARACSPEPCTPELRFLGMVWDDARTLRWASYIGRPGKGGLHIGQSGLGQLPDTDGHVQPQLP